MQKQGFSRGAPHERSRGSYSSPRQDARPPRAQPKAEPTVLASAIRLKNFRQLHELVGEENLAMALDLPLQRVRELLEGVNFSDETTFHLENTLGLRSGYFDQVNPQLSDADVKRLKSPLDHSPPTDRLPEPPTEEEIPVAPSLKSAVPQNNQANAAAARQGNASKAAGTGQSKKSAARASTPHKSPAPAPAQQSLITHDEPTVAAAAPAPAPAPARATAPTAAMPGFIDTDELKLREVRRTNLALITQQPGSKSHLGRLTGMSPANISHRLHGNKHFDQETAQFFAEKLNLPGDWFNDPHTEDDIPGHVLQMLGGSPRSNVPSNRGGRPSRTRQAAPDNHAAAAPAAMAMPSTQEGGLALHSAVLSASLQPAQAAQPAAGQPALASTARTAARRAPAPAPAAAPALATAAPAVAVAPAPAAAPAAAPAPVAPAAPVMTPVAPSPVASVLAITEGELLPIAEALIKTLALKARQGKLTEEVAFKLLTETMAL